jgi:hypothetical protein
MTGMCFEQSEDDFGGKGFVAVAHDGADAGQLREFFGGALSVAACGQDSGVWIDAVGSANEGPGFPIRFGGDAARVDDNHVYVRGTALGETGSAKETGDRFAVGACGAAAEILDMERTRHSLSLAEDAEFTGLQTGWRISADFDNARSLYWR